FGIIKGKKNKTKRGMLDLALFNDELYRQFIGAYESLQRILVQKGSAGKNKGSLLALGFDDVQNFDGVEVTYEYGVPTGVGYGWSMENVELRSLQGQLFVPEGPDFDIASQSYRFSIDMFGNLRI